MPGERKILHLRKAIREHINPNAMGGKSLRQFVSVRTDPQVADGVNNRYGSDWSSHKQPTRGPFSRRLGLSPQKTLFALMVRGAGEFRCFTLTGRLSNWATKFAHKLGVSFVTTSNTFGEIGF